MVDERIYLDKLYHQFERIGKALGSARRLEILDLLSQGERSVESIATETNLSIANASQHLRTLLAARIVQVRKEGPYSFYRPSNEQVLALWHALRKVARRNLLEVDEIVSESFDTPAKSISLVELHQMIVDKENIVVIDVRPKEEFLAGRIRGAQSIPLDKLAVVSGSLSPEPVYIVYCRSAYNWMSLRAVDILEEKGLSVLHLEGGVPDWKMMGLPTTRTSFPSRSNLSID